MLFILQQSLPTKVLGQRITCKMSIEYILVFCNSFIVVIHENVYH